MSDSGNLVPSEYQATVVVPTYNRRGAVERLLRALASQSVGPDAFEVIVSVDGSSDGTREMVQAFPAPYALRCLWQTNRGPAAARNAAIREACGRVLVILDDDMEPTPGFLAAHLAAHAREERLAVVGTVPVKVEPSAPRVARYIVRKTQQHLDRLAEPGRTFGVRDFYTGNFSIRRDLLLEVGLYDEGFRIYGSEDLEMGVRLRQAGVRIVFSKEAAAWERYSKNLADLAKDKTAAGRTAVLLAGKHPEAIPESKLGTYNQASRKWRLLRRVLLEASGLFPWTPALVLKVASGLERVLPPDADLLYVMTLDYYFWLGVRRALAEQPRQARGRTPLTGMTDRPRI